MNQVANGWGWLIFLIFIISALSIDTFFLDKKYARPHHSMRAALSWTLLWVSCALIFNGLLWLYLSLTANNAIANEKALLFFTGYLIEKSLSLDNIFTFFIIFKSLQIPLPSQQRVFSCGIWSAIVMRLVLIVMGTWLIAHFHWVLYLMGGFLLISGLKLLIEREKETNIMESPTILFLKKIFPFVPECHGNKFFIKKNTLFYMTPLFVALVLIEMSDLVFALDSISAIFSITQDPFIVYTSNIFAILGLRAMYFLLAGMFTQFNLIKYGIALILIFIGTKMVIEPWWSISTGLSLGIVASILILFIIISLFFAKKLEGNK